VFRVAGFEIRIKGSVFRDGNVYIFSSFSPSYGRVAQVPIDLRITTLCPAARNKPLVHGEQLSVADGRGFS
jgi:hypothetical protein